MELHYRIVLPSAQVGFEGTYGHVLSHRLHLSTFGVVLAIFEKRSIGFRIISHYLALFALSAKCQFSTSEGHKTSINDY